MDNIYILRHSKCPKCASLVPNKPSAKEFVEMAEEARQAMIKAEKMSFWRQFERGMLSSEAVQVLVNICDVCIDEHDRFVSTDDYRKR